ncbi:MAG: hypothetical protein ACKVOB_13365 [Sphingomonas sp.]
MPDIEQARLSSATHKGYAIGCIPWRACINGLFDDAPAFRAHWDEMLLRERAEVVE